MNPSFGLVFLKKAITVIFIKVFFISNMMEILCKKLNLWRYSTELGQTELGQTENFKDVRLKLVNLNVVRLKTVDFLLKNSLEEKDATQSPWGFSDIKVSIEFYLELHMSLYVSEK